ncbi:MAG: thiamine pyrophosphate-binding protein [Prevotella sp.]
MSRNIHRGGVNGYTSERNIQIVISLLKQNGIRRIVTSPGATNVTFVGSLQNDSFFEMYSCVDERSAAYMANGLCAESGEPVVLSCTGATSSRNYLPALTDAYYRKLPILAVTSSQFSSRIGQMVAQVTDRTSPPVDTVLRTFNLETVKDKDDEWNCTIKANEAISSLTKFGGGPVHINLVTCYSRDFSTKTLPSAKSIRRIDFNSDFPALPEGKIGIFVGSHLRFPDSLTSAVDAFCDSHNAVVLCDSSSNYYGKYRVQMPMALIQKYYYPSCLNLSLLIHIGEITGDYTINRIKAKEVWRVNEDGEIRDYFHRITCMFNMTEEYFFRHYSTDKHSMAGMLLSECRDELHRVSSKINELPFSNLWIAQHTATKIPSGSQVHLGILNCLRSWNVFPFPEGVESSSNVGGFGIDGCLSTMIGSAMANKNKLFFGIFGDLSFFYDMNAVTTSDIGGNVRIMLINNGRGTEFRNPGHIAAEFGEAADPYMAAAGHFGNKSMALVKDLAHDLGFNYLSATTKEEFLSVYEQFVDSNLSDRPMIFEVFTDTADEIQALSMMENTMADKKTVIKQHIKQTLKELIGEKAVSILKKRVNR